MKRYLTASIISFALLANPVIAAAQGCLTPVEARALVKVAMPDVIKGVADKCRASLDGSTFVALSSTDMIARYRVASDGSWAAAKPSFSKLAKGQAALIEQLPDDALKPLLGAFISAEIAKGVKPENCAGVDRAMAAIAPLPADNMADLLVAIIELSGGGKGSASSFNICKAAEGRPAPVARPIGSTASK